MVWALSAYTRETVRLRTRLAAPTATSLLTEGSEFVLSFGSPFGIGGTNRVRHDSTVWIQL